MNEPRLTQNRSDFSDKSDPFGILSLFRSDVRSHESDQSDRAKSPDLARPTGPTAVATGRAEIDKQKQCGPIGPTGPTRERECAGAVPSSCGKLVPKREALASIEERASIREMDSGQGLEPTGAAVLAEATQATGNATDALQRLWADNTDARAYLAHLLRHGPAIYGAVASTLDWGATRAWQAEARLRAAGLVHYDEGKATPKSGKLSP